MTCVYFGSFFSHELYRVSQVRVKAIEIIRQRLEIRFARGTYSQRPVVVAGWLEGDLTRQVEGAGRRQEAVNPGLVFAMRTAPRKPPGSFTSVWWASLATSIATYTPEVEDEMASLV